MTGFSNIGTASGFAGIDGEGNPSGDLTGSYPNPLVVGLWDQPIDPRSPAEGDSLIFHAGGWVPTPSPTSITFFKGPWNADTNTPDLLNYPGLADGYTWIVTVAGSYSGLDAITSWEVGDYALYSNGNWYKLSSKTFGWGLTGNAGTVAGIDFVGTTDQTDLVLKSNDSERLRLYWTGGSRLSGTVSVTENLQVAGNVTGSNAKLTGDLAVCGGDVTTNSPVFNLLLGATSRINMGNSGATNWISGTTQFPQGISGSITNLVDGTSAFVGGTGIQVISSSNGPVIFENKGVQSTTAANGPSATGVSVNSSIVTVNVSDPGHSHGVTDPTHSHTTSAVVAENVPIPTIAHETFNVQNDGTVFHTITLPSVTTPVAFNGTQIANPRVLEVNFANAWNGGNVTVVGTDLTGSAVTETFNSAPGAIVVGSKPFAFISTVSHTLAGSGAGSTRVQASTRMAVMNTPVNSFLKCTIAGSPDGFVPASTNLSLGVFESTGNHSGKILEVWYTYNLSPIQVSHSHTVSSSSTGVSVDSGLTGTTATSPSHSHGITDPTHNHAQSPHGHAVTP